MSPGLLLLSSICTEYQFSISLKAFATGVLLNERIPFTHLFSVTVSYCCFVKLLLEFAHDAF